MSSGRTIHKAQSATHTEVVVDMSGPERCPPTFWEHMHYVAFSRCTTLKGLHIIDINESKIRASPKVVKFLQEEKQSLELCYEPSYNTKSPFMVAFNNVGSLLHKWPAIECNHNFINCDVIVIAETWLSTKHPAGTCALPGFEQIRMDSDILPGHRGQIMYIQHAVKVTESYQHQTTNIEFLHCLVQKDDHEWHVIGVYKPPQVSQALFCGDLDSYLSGIDKSKPVVIVGDFNIDISSPRGSKFVKYMETNHNLTQMVKDTTTWEGTTIDLVFSNVPHIKVDALTTTWSKHHMLVAKLPSS